ncbi:MAG: AsmA family protein [Gammaproteobacteria bacterium]
MVIRLIIKGLAAILLLMLLVAVAVIALFDPNDYKKQIEAAVEQTTGRPLALNAPLEWTLYPWLGMRTGDVTLGNSKGFDEGHLLSAQQASLRVKLLPLLKGELVTDTVLLDGAEIHMQVREDGRDNWSDLFTGKGGEPAGATDTSLRRININGTDIRNSVMTYADRTTGREYRLDIRQAQTGIIDMESPIPLTLDMTLSGTGVPATSILFNGSVTTDLARRSWSIANLKLTLTPDKQPALRLRGGIEVDMQARTLLLSDFRLEREQALASGELLLHGFEGIPSMRGHILLRDFVPGAILALAGDHALHDPLMHLPFSGSLRFEADRNSMKVPAFDLSVDGERFSGSLDASSLDPLHASFRLDAGNLDPDKYLSREQAHDTANGGEGVASIPAQAQMRLTGDVRIASVKHGALQAKNIAFALDHQRNVMKLDRLSADVLGIPVTGAVTLSDPAGRISYAGSLKLARFNPVSVMKELGMVAPVTRDDKVLSSASGSIEFAGDLQHARLTSRGFRIDDSTISGSLTLKDFADASYGFDLDIDAIDLDRYLPPAGGPADGGSSGDAREALRLPELSGRVAIGMLEVADIRLGDFTTAIEAAGSRLRLAEMSGRLYEGSFSGDIRLDATDSLLSWTANETFTGVSAGPLLKALADSDRLSGTLDMQSSLSGSGTSMEEILSSLSGTASFDVRNGSIRGVNIARALREVKARLRGEPAGDGEGGEQKTDFTRLQGTATIRNGILTNRDLVAKSPFLRVTGDGSIDLGAGRMNYLTNVKVVKTGEGQGGKEFPELEGLIIPLRIEGPFNNLSYSPDIESLLGGRAAQEFEKQKEELREMARERLGERLGREEEDAGENSGKSAGEGLEEELGQTLLEGLGL